MPGDPTDEEIVFSLTRAAAKTLVARGHREGRAEAAKAHTRKYSIARFTLYALLIAGPSFVLGVAAATVWGWGG